MQAHMSKNMPQMMQPSLEQQKTIQLQMLAHMKKEFASDEDLFGKVSDLESNLQQGKLNAIEANMQMRALQQELLGRRMKHMQKQGQLQGGKAKEEEETPMRDMADEDL